MLTSVKNPRAQFIRKLQSQSRFRRSEDKFVVEGVRLIEEALESGWQPEYIFFTDDLNSRGQQILKTYGQRSVEVIQVSPHVMESVSDTQTPQGILGVFPIQSRPIPESPDFLLILDGVRDPGNVGTILRTALAAGVDAVIAPSGTADPFSPKVVRAGMGAHFKLAIHTMEWQALEMLLSGMSVFLADSSGGQPHYNLDFASPLALIIGGEAAGAGKKSDVLATHRVHIPMPGNAESLNAAVAASILIFEVVRQRLGNIDG